MYCPNPGMENDARVICEQTLLPMQIGDSTKTEHLNFDRNVAQVLLIPEVRTFTISSKEVNCGFHQAVQYINEFDDSAKTCSLYHNRLLVKPLYRESHRVMWTFICSNVGENNLQLLDSDSIICKEIFNVN